MIYSVSGTDYSVHYVQRGVNSEPIPVKEIDFEGMAAGKYGSFNMVDINVAQAMGISVANLTDGSLSGDKLKEADAGRALVEEMFRIARETPSNNAGVELMFNFERLRACSVSFCACSFERIFRQTRQF